MLPFRLPTLLRPRPASAAGRALRAIHALCAGLALAVAAPSFAVAQELAADNPDWKESAVPSPPSFDVKRLVNIEMPTYSAVKVGIDPQTMVVTGDGIVRYVVVAINRDGSSVNAFYEGVRCATGEMKTYARWGDDGQWNIVQAPEWQRIRLMQSRHTQALAQQGLCRGRAPRQTVGEMIREIRQPFLLTY